MSVQIEARLAELRQEYQAGETQLRELMIRETALRETLLRISGAIQVLAELSAPATGNGRPATLPGTEPVSDPGGPVLLTVG